MADILFNVADVLAHFREKSEWPALITFGPATLTDLKHLCPPPAYMDYFSPGSIFGIKYQVKDDIPHGEVRFNKWVTEGGERKLRVYRTVRAL